MQRPSVPKLVFLILSTDFVDNTEPDVVECLVRIREDKAEAVEPQMEPTEGNA